MSIDGVINQMKETKCLDCYCERATYDKTNEVVNLYGSFCYPQSNLQMIQITAYDSDQNVVWSQECETGKTCSNPFTSVEGMKCTFA